jgi:hypothetical protein
MKKIALVAVIASLVVAAYLHAQPNTLLSFGPTYTILDTSSTGAVNGSTFALPSNTAQVVNWQVTYAGGPSAVSTFLQYSLDGTTWFNYNNTTTTAGHASTAGLSAWKFIRATQSGRTGGTQTLVQVVVARAYAFTTASGGNPTLSGNLLFSPDATYTIGGSSTTLRPATIWASGTINSGSSVTGANLQANSGGVISFSSRSRFTAAADGNIQISNAAATDFGLLQFGGTTNAFPALKRSGTQLQFRLADDSNSASLAAQSISYNSTAFASLPADGNGTVRYCSDCLANSSPCSGASTGAIAKRLNGVWDCR